MEGIRLIELPACHMASSGPSSIEGGMNGFDAWFTAVDAARADRFFPRDFMWFDSRSQSMVWYYALPPGGDAGPWPVVEFPGGLFAVAVSIDGDDMDGERVYAGIKEWVDAQPHLELAEGPGWETMFHIVTSPAGAAVLGHHQLDIWVPVRAR